MNRMNGVNIYNVYQESLWRLKNKVGDHRDQVIVDQWETGKRLTDEKKELKKQLDQRDKIISEQAFALDIFHSRVDRGICGESNVGSYLKGLLTSSQIMVH